MRKEKTEPVGMRERSGDGGGGGFRGVSGEPGFKEIVAATDDGCGPLVAEGIERGFGRRSDVGIPGRRIHPAKRGRDENFCRNAKKFSNSRKKHHLLRLVIIFIRQTNRQGLFWN